MRSEESGPDMKLSFRLLVIHPSAYIHQKYWLMTLEKEPPHLRDYFLPAPTNNFRGFKKKELTYQTAFAVQSRIISRASYRGVDDIQNQHRALLHAPQRAELHAHRDCSSQLQPNRSRHVGLMGGGKGAKDTLELQNT